MGNLTCRFFEHDQSPFTDEYAPAGYEISTCHRCGHTLFRSAEDALLTNQYGDPWREDRYSVRVPEVEAWPFAVCEVGRVPWASGVKHAPSLVLLSCLSRGEARFAAKVINRTLALADSNGPEMTIARILHQCRHLCPEDSIFRKRTTPPQDKGE